MSKEKQCECCHEWWYDSVIKEDLCPNCYDYFKQLKQRLAEKQNTINEINKEFVQAVHDWKALCAEKDKELAYMTKQAKKFNNEAQKYYEDAYCNNFQNQKAIAELEKVKEKISKLPITDILDTDYGSFKKIYQTDAMRIIDRQINELKGDNNECK